VIKPKVLNDGFGCTLCVQSSYIQAEVDATGHNMQRQGQGPASHCQGGYHKNYKSEYITIVKQL